MHVPMRPPHNRIIASFLAIGLALCLLWLQVHSATAAPQPQAATVDTATINTATSDEPLDCINPLKNAHIAASIASLVPVPFFKDAADLAAYGLNLELKNCPPHLEPAANLVRQPVPGECSIDLRMPIAVNYNSLVQVDKEIIGEVLRDPELSAVPGLAVELERELGLAYGRFENEIYGSYVNIYGIQLPLNHSEFAANDWGSVGRPEIYHYNSDALITLRHPGERLNTEYVRFDAGTHALNWQADTLLSSFDYVYFPNLAGAAAAGKRAGKEGAVQALKNAIKEAIKKASEQGAKEFSKKIAKEIAKDVAKRVGFKVLSIVTRVRQPYFVSGSPNATTYQTQYLMVIDNVPPTISGVQDVTVEALEPGGLSANKEIAALQAALTIRDNCDKTPTLRYNTPSFWPLGASNIITWTAVDSGAVDANGGVNETQAVQRVSVVDTMPPILVAPPPVIMEATGSAVNVPLGSPQVFDVADLRPTITNNAPTQFTNGIYRIDWTATDGSGNVSAKGTNTQQIVNIKAAGTNKLPTAMAQTGGNTIQATADEAIKITVRGQDGDSTPDPLWFSVENQPEHGFFIAPLYPYFINDYRMTARYSPWIAAREGEEIAWQVAQDSNSLHQYMKTLCTENINRTDLPRDFVNGFEYFAVDDQGYTYIYDTFYKACTPGGSTVAPYTAPRISVWDAKGTLIGQQERSSSGHPLHSVKFNVARGTIISVNSDGSTTGTSTVDISTIQPENSNQPVKSLQFYGLHNNINDIYVGSAQTSRRPEYKNARAAALDNKKGILYLIGTNNQTGLAAFKLAPCDNRPEDGPTACLDLLGVQVYSYAIAQSTSWNEFPGVGVDAMRLQQINDIALDSHGAVYISANNGTGFSRIYKFAPATVQPDGSTTLGEFLGWMGKCDSGPNCDYIHDRSIGFLCTDESCFLDQGATTYGDRPGQFDGIASLAFDRNDVLYVGDGGNKRVQRFSSDGLFAGEARSTGDGSGFVLGDFAGVNNIAVNSRSFYIVDTFREIVHVFDAAVIHGIDESSAWVEYQSNTNYVGADSFTFAATDGFRTINGVTGETELLKSAPATVAINVSRNHRPPQATKDLAFMTAEDTPLAITLTGNDLDNFGEQRDPLTFQVVRQPLAGTLSGSGANRTYTPDADFTGEDSFTFTVSDDRFTSEPETVALTVTPVNDAPAVLPESTTLRSGAGYPLTLRATVVDAEADDTHTIQVDWGDGSVENEGQIGGDSMPTGPILIDNDTFTSTLTAFHTYSAAGSYTIKVTATDSAGATGEVTVAVTVDAMADLVLTRQGSTVVSANQPTLSYELLVTHDAPHNGGVNATGVTVHETLGRGLRYRLAAPDSGTCNASGQSLTCNLGALAPDATNKIRIVVDAEADLVVGTEVTAFSTVAAETADPIGENNSVDGKITMLYSADFLVDGFQEGTDATPGDGICATAQGICTIRAAIQEANALPGKQTIALARGVYLLNVFPGGNTTTVEPSPENNSATGDLDITADLEILGLSADDTTIHANGGDRVIEVLTGAKVILRDLMLTGGLPLPFDNSGGALRNSGGEVTLQRVTMTGNVAPGGGGAVHNQSGTLRVEASALVGNWAGSLTGGPVRSQAMGQLDGRTVDQLGSEEIGSGAVGGGLWNEGTLVLENVTVSDNQAVQGGGLAVTGGSVTVTNSTLYANSAASDGGGIWSAGDTVRIENTILAGNSAGVTGPDCTAQVRSAGHNLLSNLSDCSILGETVTNIIDANVGLEALSAADGETYGHSPLPTSRAVNAGTCTLAFDQRGVERPQGGGCDIGALEYGGVVVVSTLYLPVVAR